jgi:hypothetical protein
VKKNRTQGSDRPDNLAEMRSAIMASDLGAERSSDEFTCGLAGPLFPARQVSKGLKGGLPSWHIMRRRLIWLGKPTHIVSP